jgi:CheY-like chemotaxis protein
MMPGLNGYEVCQKIRQQYSQIELPVILVTAKNHLEDLTQGFKTGANDFLAKQFHGEELRSRVENQLRLSLLHKINEDNVRLQSQIETYAEADRELRSSRFRLQRVLESINTGFIAFELPGTIFSLNQRAADLSGSDKETLLGKSIGSILSDNQINEGVRGAITQWELGDLNSLDNNHDSHNTNRDSQDISNLNVDLEVIYPYNSINKSTRKTIEFTSKLKLFGDDEGTGVLFLEGSDSGQDFSQTGVITDTADLSAYSDRPSKIFDALAQDSTL